MHRQNLRGWVQPDQSSEPLGLRLEQLEQGLAQQVALAPAGADPARQQPVQEKTAPVREV